jgi:hypothetical protein
MRKWAYRQKNMYWRNLASGALELEDAIDYSKFFSFAPPDLLKIFPPAKVIDAMRVRLDADKAADTHQRRHLPALGGQTTPADALQAGDITITGDTATAHDFSPTSTHHPRTPSNSSSAHRRRRVLAAMAVRVAVHQPAPASTQAVSLDLAPDLICTNSTQAHCVDVEH